MRNILFAASAVAALAVPGAASAQILSGGRRLRAAADRLRRAARRPYAQPPAVVGAPMVQSQVYLAPNATYVAPGTVYDDQAIYMNGQRYYRDCWWDWGRRRCELKPWW